MIELDGSHGEGGGQILRSALGLSLVTGQPFRIDKIRAGRKNPGLLRQHLTAVQAAAEVGAADVSGAHIGSKEITFRPSRIKGGDYTFAIGTAGSATLVLQTVLPALLVAQEASALRLEGGTHNPFAPPFDFLARVFLPLLARMGAKVTARLLRYGFYPAGGGQVEIAVEPCAQLKRLDLSERGEVLETRAQALVANLPRQIAEREAQILRRKLELDDDRVEVIETTNSAGPGNAAMVEVESKNLTELFVAFGERGVRAEEVATRVAREANEYRNSGAAVGEHLADQLLIPLALGEGGIFTTVKPSPHTMTNIEVIRRFLDVRIDVENPSHRDYRICVN